MDIVLIIDNFNLFIMELFNFDNFIMVARLILDCFIQAIASIIHNLIFVIILVLNNNLS